MLHEVIETLNARVAVRTRYDNFIGGEWVAPVEGRYFDNISPVTGKSVCQIARSQAADIELALDVHCKFMAEANLPPCGFGGQVFYPKRALQLGDTNSVIGSALWPAG